MMTGFLPIAGAGGSAAAECTGGGLCELVIFGSGEGGSRNIRVRVDIIVHARIKYVGKYQQRTL
eukprot:COSAG05_NODE_1795_length_4077_cov_2.741830_5_plen_64_part_00